LNSGFEVCDDACPLLSRLGINLPYSFRIVKSISAPLALCGLAERPDVNNFRWWQRSKKNPHRGSKVLLRIPRDSIDEFLTRDSSIVSQKYLGIILCATLPFVRRRSLRAAISLQGISEGHGGLFQNRETKGTLPGDQLQVMGEAGGGLPGNSHARRNMEMTDAPAPPAFAAL
jgi:hypothetical protein